MVTSPGKDEHVVTSSDTTPFVDGNAPVRWGIIGTGQIAKKFAIGLEFAPGAKLVAIGSRNQANADAFGDQFNVPNRYDSYADLANDPEVDVVYVATPHPDHRDSTILCLNAGKHVLCEKPFAMNAAETREMIDAARSNNRFLMEAMWTRFRPVMCKVRELIAEDAVGEIQLVTANIGWKSRFDAEFRLYNPVLGGGALLDGGVYPVSFVSMVLGAPDTVTGVATLGESNVDEQATISLHHPSGAVAAVGITIRANPVSLGMIVGTKGTILIDHDFHKPESFSLLVPGQEPQKFALPLTEGNGYQFEAIEVMRCLREGLTESPVMPLDESLTIVETMETLLRDWGVKYPSDR
jgi:predicted dehydrogenase